MYVVFFFCRLAFPYSTSVVFGPGDDGVAVVVEGAGEDLVRVALQNLQAVAAVCLPHPRGLVTDHNNHIHTHTYTYIHIHTNTSMRLNAMNLEAVSMREPCGLNATFEISPSWPARMAAAHIYTQTIMNNVQINIYAQILIKHTIHDQILKTIDTTVSHNMNIGRAVFMSMYVCMYV